MHVFKLDYTNTLIDIENNVIEKHDFMKDWYKNKSNSQTMMQQKI